jgi:hypothetical protein
MTWPKRAANQVSETIATSMAGATAHRGQAHYVPAYHPKNCAIANRVTASCWVNQWRDWTQCHGKSLYADIETGDATELWNDVNIPQMFAEHPKLSLERI